MSHKEIKDFSQIILLQNKKYFEVSELTCGYKQTFPVARSKISATGPFVFCGH
jgi:predicted nucleic-acid-binding Zn-ribbon protein